MSAANALMDDLECKYLYDQYQTSYSQCNTAIIYIYLYSIYPKIWAVKFYIYKGGDVRMEER